MTTPTCSVVVCTRHRPTLLERCLASLVQLDHPSYEVVVVDNTPGEREVARAAAEAGARYVIERRVGLSRARNTGARLAEGAIVAYIDDDAAAETDWLSRHAIALEDPATVATTGRVLPMAAETAAARTYWAASAEDLGEVPFRVDRATPAWFEMANFGGVGVGSNMAFRRTLFERGWGFRESLGLGAGILGEEAYAFFTILRAGHAIAYRPDAIVRHEYPATMPALREKRLRILRGSAAYMLMLLVEEREFRGRTVRYLWEAARGTPREWRRGGTGDRLGSRLQLLAAAAAGVPLYLRFLIANGLVNRPPLPGPPTEPELRPPSVPS